MTKMSQEEREVILKRMKEITSKVHHLDVTRTCEMTLFDRCKLAARLTDEWLANFRKLKSGE